MERNRTSEWKQGQIVAIKYADCTFYYKLKEQMTPLCWDAYLLDEDNQIRFMNGSTPIVHTVCDFKEQI